MNFLFKIFTAMEMRPLSVTATLLSMIQWNAHGWQVLSVKVCMFYTYCSLTIVHVVTRYLLNCLSKTWEVAIIIHCLFLTLS